MTRSRAYNNAYVQRWRIAITVIDKIRVGTSANFHFTSDCAIWFMRSAVNKVRGGENRGHVQFVGEIFMNEPRRRGRDTATARLREVARNVFCTFFLHVSQSSLVSSRSISLSDLLSRFRSARRFARLHVAVFRCTPREQNAKMSWNEQSICDDIHWQSRGKLAWQRKTMDTIAICKNRKEGKRIALDYPMIISPWHWM